MMSTEIYIFDRAQDTKPFETPIAGVSLVLVRPVGLPSFTEVVLEIKEAILNEAENIFSNLRPWGIFFNAVDRTSF